MKRTYIQPKVQVAQIEMESCILIGSPVAPANALGVKSASTDDMW